MARIGLLAVISLGWIRVREAPVNLVHLERAKAEARCELPIPIQANRFSAGSLALSSEIETAAR